MELKKLDLRKIDSLCNNHAIGLDQMGEILPKIWKILTDENQTMVLNEITSIYVQCGSVEKTVEKILNKH